MDKAGNPATDPNQVACYLPVGGPKGSGLALMFECLSSVMVGNPLLEPILFSREIKPQAQGEKAATAGVPSRYVGRSMQNSIVAAIDIGMFTDVESYKEHIDNLIDGIKALPKAEGFDEIFVPGEPEERTFNERSKNGIPLPDGTVRNLRSIAERFGIKLPLGL